jgi:diacylglycerol kinase family enzyme
MRTRYSKWRAFAIAIRLAYRHFPQVALVVETDTHMTTVRTPFFVVAVNAYDLDQRQLLATKQALDQGRLTVYWLARRRRTDFIKSIWRYLRGQADRIEGLRRFHTRDLRLQTSRETLQVAIDGELETLRSPIQIRIVPQSLRVKVPRD